jgi:tetratricopeptide (TPR) repeat protein
MKTTHWYARLASRIFIASAITVALPTPQQTVEAALTNPTLTTPNHHWLQVASVPEPPVPAESLPSHALILGVPFISLGEAKQLEYARKNIVNPSIAAAQGMVLKYWGQDLNQLQEEKQDWAKEEYHYAKSLEELKPWINRRIPVMVSPVALTPTAHTLYPLVRMFVSTGQIPKSLIQPKGPISGMLGTMVPLEVFQQIEHSGIDFNYVRESVTATARVMVGYDDTRKVVTLHDASFGPGWEVSYEDFDRMWAAGGRSYGVVYPSNYTEILAKRSAVPAYPSRTPEQRAAEAYVMGYALSAAGRQAEAETRFREGLAIPGISRGMQHLLQLELAGQLLCCRGDFDAGMVAYQSAIALLPENSAPWFILADIYEKSGQTKKAAEAKQTAEELSKNQQALNVLEKTLPADLGYGASLRTTFIPAQ